VEGLEISKRKWWVGALLSFLLPGLGQIYNGQPKKGLIFWAIHLSWFAVFAFPFLLGLTISVWLAAAACEILWRVVVAVEAGITATRSENYVLQPYNKAPRYVLIFIIAIGISTGFKYLIKANLVQAFKIPSASMAPTVLVGDHILVDKRPSATNPVRGSLIVFIYPEDPTKDFIRRVVAVGGDTVEMRDKILYVNKIPSGDEYAVHLEKDIVPATQNPRDNFPPKLVPEGAFFTLGDNRDRSYDSRFWGFVPKQNVRGTVKVIYWSWDSQNGKVRWSRIGKELR